MTQIAKQIGGSIRKNLIINGGSNIFQRSLDAPAITSGFFGADRFGTFRAGVSPTIRNFRSTTIPTGSNSVSPNSNAYENVVATPVVAAGDLREFQTTIEGYDIAPFAEQWLTLSFWFRATKAGTYCVFLQGNTGQGSWVEEFTVDTPNVFQFFEIPFFYSPIAIAAAGGAASSTTGGGLVLGITLVAGSTRQTATTGAWTSGNLFATSNQVNWAEIINETIYCHGMMLNPGTKALPFIRAGGGTFEDEFAAAQRYYEKSYKVDTAPGTITFPGSHRERSTTSASSQFYSIDFNVVKRATPTMTVYSPNTGNPNVFYNDSGLADVSGIADQIGQGHWNARTAAGLGGDSLVSFQWTADSEF